MAAVAPSSMLNIEGFTATGDYARTIHLTGADGMEAAILTRGCRVLDLRLRDGRSMVLPVSTLAEVEADESYINVAVGRTANRIEGGKFALDGKEVILQCNENGQNQLHGGTVGWDKKLFAVRDQGLNYVELFLVSPDLDQGFPSSVEVSIRYELDGTGGFTVTMSTSNVGKEATVTNMTLHPYLDLSGQLGQARDSVLEYEMEAPRCTCHLVLNDKNVPTGDIAFVKGTPFDFCQGKKISQDMPSSGYDNYFVASDQDTLNGPVLPLLTITAPAGEHGPAVTMEVISNQPGFQMYTANGFSGDGAGSFEKHGSIAIEPSGYIDATNHMNFPTATLNPHETRKQVITYHFTTLST